MSTTWPEGVIARYLTVGGGPVDVVEQSAWTDIKHPTEHHVICAGCEATHTEEWGFDFWAHERGAEQPDTFDRDGRWTLPAARAWAQSHAETCRALPAPDGAR